MPSTLIFDNPVTQIFAGWGWDEKLLLLTAPVLWLVKKFTGFMGSETWDFFGVILIAFTLKFQIESAEKTARIEIAKVLTEAFSHSEMFEAIDYFKKVSPHLVDENGKENKGYIELIQNAPETQRYRYQILTTLHHAERLYQKEKEAEKVLFTSLITPDIVEVSLCLYKLDDYMKEVDKPVYEMVYRVFEDIRTSYLAPYVDALNNKKEIASKRLQETRRILKALQAWDRQWGDDGDRIFTEKDLILFNLVEASFSNEAFQTSLDSWNELIKRFENSQSKVPSLKKRKVSAELYSYRGAAKFKLEDYKGSIKDLNKAIKLNPQEATNYYNRGFSKYKQVDYVGAIKDYSEAIELNFQTAYVYNNRGMAKGKQNKHKEAIEDYSKAIELDNKYLTGYFNRGFSQYTLENYEGAIEDYSAVIDLDPQNAKAYGIRGGAYEKIGKHKEAQADFAEYKRLKDLEQ